MKRVYIVFLIFFVGFSTLEAVNPAYIKTKVKNRAQLQKNTGAFKHSKYNYVSERETKASRYKDNVNLGVVNVNKGEHIRDANVYIDSKSKIDIRNKRNSKVQVGVVNVGKNARLKSANVNVNARKGIDIRQQTGNKKRVSQIGVVNLKKSSNVKNIRTRVNTREKINIKNY